MPHQPPPLETRLHAYADRLDGRLALWGGPLSRQIEAALARLAAEDTVAALYRKTPSIWSSVPDVRAKIANRLGWLSAPDEMVGHLPRIKAFADQVVSDGITDVVLLGMGGSSLAPEVLRAIVGVRAGRPRFQMLDSTDPDGVLAIDRSINLARTLFLLASKSGGTIEPNSMAAYFKERLESSGIAAWAKQFVAITDHGTALHRRAQEEGFRDIFVNPSDIGGRYSAVSLFGLVPAALMGHDIEAFVDWARAMLWLCGPSRPLSTNPAALLGAAMAVGAQCGRDKTTLVLPEALATFGLWVEQLVAESTGKDGRGVVPVAGERLGDPLSYGDDRLFVELSIEGDASPRPVETLRTLAAAGSPWAEIRLPEPAALGAEFVRWELATALAGALLGVNPFDEPNVAQAKAATQALLSGRDAGGTLPRPAGGLVFGGATVWMTSAASANMSTADPARFFDMVGAGDYVALLAYLGPDPALERPLADLRERLRARQRCATTFGYGPRYLHSTGQLHKGGANNGVFVVLFGHSTAGAPVPGEDFSFGVLEHAQALGDFASLEATGRRAMAVELPRQSSDAIEAWCRSFLV